MTTRWSLSLQMLNIRCSSTARGHDHQVVIEFTDVEHQMFNRMQGSWPPGGHWVWRCWTSDVQVYKVTTHQMSWSIDYVWTSDVQVYKVTTHRMSCRLKNFWTSDVQWVPSTMTTRWSMSYSDDHLVVMGWNGDGHLMAIGLHRKKINRFYDREILGGPRGAGTRFPENPGFCHFPN